MKPAPFAKPVRIGGIIRMAGAAPELGVSFIGLTFAQTGGTTGGNASSPVCLDTTHGTANARTLAAAAHQPELIR